MMYGTLVAGIFIDHLGQHARETYNESMNDTDQILREAVLRTVYTRLEYFTLVEARWRDLEPPHLTDPARIEDTSIFDNGELQTV